MLRLLLLPRNTLVRKKYIFLCVCAGKGFEPIYLGNEPVMLLLHQPANKGNAFFFLELRNKYQPWPLPLITKKEFFSFFFLYSNFKLNAPY